MVGNVEEWVADWVPRSLACASGPAAPPVFDGLGQNCFAGANNSPDTDGFITAALIRGQTGVYAVSGNRGPATQEANLGFRAVR
jgi:formylglycine-generating enzyme required for sulfatase activity